MTFRHKPRVEIDPTRVTHGQVSPVKVPPAGFAADRLGSDPGLELLPGDAATGIGAAGGIIAILTGFGCIDAIEADLHRAEDQAVAVLDVRLTAEDLITRRWQGEAGHHRQSQAASYVSQRGQT